MQFSKLTSVQTKEVVDIITEQLGSPTDSILFNKTLREIANDARRTCNMRWNMNAYIVNKKNPEITGDMKLRVLDAISRKIADDVDAKFIAYVAALVKAEVRETTKKKC